MAGGRPRTVSLPPDQMIALGKEMIKWVKENDPLHISMFYSVHKEILDDDWECMIRCKEFSGYYERAMRLIGAKYLDKNSNVREGASQRWQRVYFKDVAREEDATFDRKLEKEYEKKKKLIEYQAKISSEAISKVEAGIEEQYMAHMAMLKEMRQEMSSLASADISKSKDKKS